MVDVQGNPLGASSEGRVVIRFDFTGRVRRERYWLIIERGDTEICKEYPGFDEDLFITAEAEAFVKVARRPAQLGRGLSRQPYSAPRPVASSSGPSPPGMRVAHLPTSLSQPALGPSGGHLAALDQ